MKPTLTLEPALTFLGALREHNQREWFEANRTRYEQARGLFAGLVEQMIVEIGKFDDLGWVEPEECIFRIHRDVRFSKDKTPYKPNMGALIGRGGRKDGLGYYLHLEAGNRSMLAGGLHEPSPEALARFRKAIARDAGPFKTLVENKAFVRSFGAVGGERVATAPQGYARDHPEIELLRFKQVVAAHALTDADVLAPDFVKQAARVYKAMHPFLEYLRQVTR